LPEERPKISNGWGEEVKKLKALYRAGAAMAILFLVLVVITFMMHGLDL
jgi:hypothetical protein